jgi:hypothetical protein
LPGGQITNNKIMKTAIPKHIFSLLLLGMLLTASISSMAQNTGITASKLFGRKYKTGETYRYKLTTEEWHSGKWDHTSIVICELKVIKDSMGIPYDEVRWISKKMMTPKDTVDATKSALTVKPYRISLDPRGRIDIPRIEVPEMTGAIEDFNTFFVAISPLVGVSKLIKKGDSVLAKDPITADFSNGSTILKGQDCIGLSIKLTELTKSRAILYTPFFPPSKPCLNFLTPDMNTPVVADTINNFQMVMQTGNEQYLVQYGREFFYINSTVRRSDGKIITATMFNILNLKQKINCDKEYKNCQFEMPFSEQRNLKLELVQ